MDGSSGPTTDPKSAPRRKKKPAAKAPAKKLVEKSVPFGGVNDDPFEIAASPQARRAIACSPNRTKSRPLRVICPMCDTQGYIPPSAVGKQVKCLNSECMVPLFTAPEPDKPRSSGRDSRVSEKAVQQEEQLARPAKKRSPMAMYALLGGVLLVAGFGLKSYLDQEPNLDNLNTPIDVDYSLTEDDDSESGASASAGVADILDETVDVRTVVSRLAIQMIQAAELSVNRDKALCRRLTADAYLRLGDTERSQAELRQLLNVSHQRNRVDDYYRINPQATDYWAAVRQGDQDKAVALFTQMQPDAETIPKSGALAIDAIVVWGAILVQQDQAAAAQQLVEKLNVDESVRSRADLHHYGVWTAITMAAAKSGQHSESPIAMLGWKNRIATAIAVELALQEQWDSAIVWAKLWSDEFVHGDMLAEIARQAVRVKVSESVVDSIANASAISEAGQHRVEAVLAELTDDRLTSAVMTLQASANTTVCEMPLVGELLRYRVPSLTSSHQSARSLADLARSAASRGKTDVAAEVIVSLFNQLVTDLPPTIAVRAASAELDQSSKAIRNRIRKHLGRSGSADVSSQFHGFRRGLDRLAKAVENRRLLLIRLLCGVVQSDGGASLNQALEASPLLVDELTADPLCQLIAGEAILAGGSVPTLAAANSVSVPRGERTVELPDDDVAAVWFNTVRAAGQKHDAQLFKAFESTGALPGLAACLRFRIVESQANQADVTILDAMAAIKSETTRENGLWVAAVWLTRGGQAKEVEDWVSGRRLAATDRVLTLSGIVSGLELADE